MGPDRGEFAFIRRLAERVGPLPPDVVGIGDDAAVLEDGTLLAIDTLVADRHFRLEWCTPEDVGWKALAVNLSDLAAMGGEPTAAVVSITLPPDATGSADRLATGLIEAARAANCPLVGGDTTNGPVLVVTVTVVGRAATGAGPVLRAGAQPGDTIFVTGSIGHAGRALELLAAGESPEPRDGAALHRPVPRLAEGRAAATAGATAMIDISDGLTGDLRHILDASGTGVELWAASIPVPAGMSAERALTGGDDYELCFTAPPSAPVAEAFTSAGLTRPSPIGTITDGDRLVRTEDGVVPFHPGGWSHEVG